MGSGPSAAVDAVLMMTPGTARVRMKPTPILVPIIIAIIPMPPVIAHVRKLKSEGALLYLWSSGGADYCRATAIELGIKDCFSGFLPKPDTYIDDQSFDAWRDCRHVHPSQVDNA